MAVVIVGGHIGGRFTLRTMLRRGGCSDTVTLQSVYELQQYFQEGYGKHTPLMDLLVLSLPPLELRQACVLLLEQRLEDVPLLVLCKQEHKALTHLAFAAGAVDVLLDSVDNELLLAKVRALLRFKHRLQYLKHRVEAVQQERGQLALSCAASSSAEAAEAQAPNPAAPAMNGTSYPNEAGEDMARDDANGGPLLTREEMDALMKDPAQADETGADVGESEESPQAYRKPFAEYARLRQDLEELSARIRHLSSTEARQ